MAGIIIAPLSAPGLTTLAAWDRILHADKLFLQTAQHPFAKPVLDAGLAFTAMDDLYASAADFDALSQAVAERLVAAGDCVYAATGDVSSTQLPAILRAAAEAGVRVETLPGVSLAEAAFPGREHGCVFTPFRMPESLDPSSAATVTELDSGARAGEVKLFLSEYFPDEWEILIASAEGSGAYRQKRILLYELDRQRNYDATTVALIPAVPFEQLRRYGFSELMAVMRRLRAPDGCPWDREQTHASLKSALLEESYEVLDAIDQGADDALVEELGDVLLQVAFHAVIAGEQGRFTERDVTTAIVSKLIYRHPHIFGDVQVRNADEVLQNWDALKMQEKRQSTVTDTLLSVPRSFPALTRSAKVQKRAARVGFDWADAEGAFPKIREETEELWNAMQTGTNVEEELGDLFFSVVNVARLLHFDPELALAGAADKFVSRFAAMERLVLADGRDFREMTLEEMDFYWEAAKRGGNGAKTS